MCLMRFSFRAIHSEEIDHEEKLKSSCIGGSEIGAVDESNGAPSGRMSSAGC